VVEVVAVVFSRVLVYGRNKTLDGQLDGGITDGVNASRRRGRLQ